jgi:short-subunit dehydrogenase
MQSLSGASMKSLRNKTVVITNASSGIGRNAAIKFAQAGANVVLAGRRESLLREVADETRNYGVQALPIKTNLTDPEDVAELAQRAQNEFGRIDVWINNAGLETGGRFEETSTEEHAHPIELNLLGTVLGSYEALRNFRKEREGVLINVGSFAGEVGPRHLAAYATSKFGIRGFAMAIRQELERNGERNIHIATIEPATHDGQLFQSFAEFASRQPVRPLSTSYDQQSVVETILDAAVNPRNQEIVVGGKVGSGMGAVRGGWPEFLQRQLSRRAERMQARREERGRTTPTSFSSAMEAGRGGYGRLRGGRGNWAKYLGFAVPALVAWAFVARRNKRALLQRERAERAA